MKTGTTIYNKVWAGMILLTMLLMWLPTTKVAAQEVPDEFPITPDSVLLKPITPVSINTSSDSLSVSLSGDSIAVNVPGASLSGITLPLIQFRPDPTRALWLALVIPGAGQIYNHKYWKLPIIYGGFLGCAYALSWNNQMLRDYSQAYLDIMDSDPTTKSYEKMLPLNYDISGREDQFKEIFKNKKNYYRKYRDMSIFAFIGVYIISVIDAYVDAELSSFDISEDLSLQLAPAVITSQPSTLNRQSADLHRNMNFQQETGLGMSLRLNF